MPYLRCPGVEVLSLIAFLHHDILEDGEPLQERLQPLDGKPVRVEVALVFLLAVELPPGIGMRIPLPLLHVQDPFHGEGKVRDADPELTANPQDTRPFLEHFHGLSPTEMLQDMTAVDNIEGLIGDGQVTYIAAIVRRRLLIKVEPDYLHLVP